MWLVREGGKSVLLRRDVFFANIAEESAAFPVRLLCRTLEGSRAGFYAWRARPAAARAKANARLGLEVAAIHAESR